MENDTEVEEVELKLDALVAITIPDLISARVDAEQLRLVLARYFKRGMEADFSTGELVDYLGVSTPSILDQAGFTDDEAERAMGVVGGLADEEIAAVET